MVERPRGDSYERDDIMDEYDDLANLLVALRAIMSLADYEIEQGKPVMSFAVEVSSIADAALRQYADGLKQPPAL